MSDDEKNPQQNEEDPSSEVVIEKTSNLKDKEVFSGEENEDIIFKMRAKLYRFDQPSKQWKERGIGDIKFLKHKETGKIRILMRREKTFKVCANHFLLPDFKLTENAGSDRSWVWSCPADFSDEEPKKEVFSLKFGSVENAQKFKAKFEECQAELKKGKSDVTSALEKLSLENKEKEEKKEEKEEEKEETK